jgi:hypothetical protein
MFNVSGAPYIERQVVCVQNLLEEGAYSHHSDVQKMAPKPFRDEQFYLGGSSKNILWRFLFVSVMF